ncbi:MAG: SDR family NAD(P)-dependent oxidoreductase [Maioricimonas sp. JB045]
MQRTVLITGSTDGIGLETARLLYSQGHHVILHGRNPEKLRQAENILTELPGGGLVNGFVADLSTLSEVEALADCVTERFHRLDVLINNAGIYSAADVITLDGLDVRFAVNTVAPYLLTQQLLPLLGRAGRVINVSSAAQAPVDVRALAGHVRLSDNAAYAQSKLALTMWSHSMADSFGTDGPVVVAVNPGSMLGSKMVRNAFRVAGKDIRIGADILSRAAVDDEFAAASGRYFDNDRGQWAPPHPDVADCEKVTEVLDVLETILELTLSPREPVNHVSTRERM